MHNFSIKGYDRPTWIYCHYSIFFFFFWYIQLCLHFETSFWIAYQHFFIMIKKIKNIIINLLKKDITEKEKKKILSVKLLQRHSLDKLTDETYIIPTLWGPLSLHIFKSALHHCCTLDFIPHYSCPHFKSFCIIVRI